MRIKIVLKVSVGVLLGFLLVKLAASNQKGLVTLTPPDTVLTVRGYALKPRDFTPVIRALAEVRSQNRPDIASEISGKVMWIHPDLREGGCFTPGTTLLRTDPEEYQLELARLKQLWDIENQELLELDIVQNELEQRGLGLRNILATSLRELDRQMDLARKQSVPEGSVDPLQKAKEQAEINVNQWQAELDKLPLRRQKLNHRKQSLEMQISLAGLNISRSEIALPYAACVTKKVVQTGQWVAKGQVLLQVESREGRELLARFSDQAARRIQGPQVGWSVQVNNAQLETVISVNPVSNPLSRAREAVISLNSDLTPATMVEVQIQAPSRSALALPHSLCMDSTALILNRDGIIETRTLVLGSMDADSQVEILSGLSSDDIIVEESASYARPGQKAKLVGRRL